MLHSGCVNHVSEAFTLEGNSLNCYLRPSPLVSCSSRRVFLHRLGLSPGYCYGWYWLDPDAPLSAKAQLYDSLSNCSGGHVKYPWWSKRKNRKVHGKITCPKSKCIAHPLSITIQVKLPDLPTIDPMSLTFRLKFIRRGGLKAERAASG